MLQVSLLGEQALGAEGGVIRLKSSRSLPLIGYLVVHAGAPNAANGSPAPSGRSPPMPRP